MKSVAANRVIEFAFEATKGHLDPFNSVDVDAVFRTPSGRTFRVPAFWAGGSKWRVRYASGELGTHSFRTECSDDSDVGLNGITGSVSVHRYSGRNVLYSHGPVHIASGKRHFAYSDGAPFFWLGDTWWMGLCKRLKWPDEFKALTKDRVKKGYTVVQIVAGLYPDMGAFDPRGANEFGFPWTDDYSRINPEYFDLADNRIDHLVESGIVPCIVGAWGYHLPWLGEARMKKHWRYLVARWGAYPVFWCVAGEANLPYYLVKGFPFDDRKQVEGWTKITRYLRELDPFHRPISIHPTGLGRLTARGAVDDEKLIDFDMLQTGHGDVGSLPPTVDTVRNSYNAKPVMPVLNSEVCYEGILDRCHADVQRLMFWSCLLSGACGHTYGANGIWQLNRKGEPYGKSPHGGTYGPFPWDEAMNLPGSAQLGYAKKLLLTLPWTELKPMPDAAKWVGGEDFPLGSWIWYPEGDPSKNAPVGKRYFRRAFMLHSTTGMERARLRITADDRCTAYVNGQLVGKHNGWNSVAEYNIDKFLHPGSNVIAVEAENIDSNVQRNPAGLLCALDIKPKLPLDESIQTDADWKVSKSEAEGWTSTNFDDTLWLKARVIAKNGEGPWGKVGQEDKYLVPYCAGIPGKLLVTYLPKARSVEVSGLENASAYTVRWFDPVNGILGRKFAIKNPLGGKWTAPEPPMPGQDWVLLSSP